jgi:hypothetical protein
MVLLTVLLVSCGSKNEVAPALPATPAPSTEAVVSYDENIKVGKFSIVERPKVLESSSGKKCSYKIRTRVDITNVVPENDLIELRIQNKERENRRNHRTCPEKYGVKESVVKTYSYAKLLDTYKARAEKSVNAKFFCEKTSWCKKAKVMTKKESLYNGHKVFYTEMKIESKSGKTYKRSSWVSRENLFLNTLSYQLRTWRSNKLVDYKKTTEF